jgi:hypothetical protein
MSIRPKVDVDFEKRTCAYFGAQGESYEEYPSVEI